jgi:replication-associated recombination protein RarA
MAAPKARGFQPKPTPHGHSFDEASSALQKSVRRGLEDDALYWAGQLDVAGYPGYVWRRLMVFAHEDVGLADPDAIVRVMALYQASLEFSKRKGQELNARAFMVQAIIYLARAPKDRTVDDATTVTYSEATDPEYRREVPDYALDRHTKRGRQMGRGWDHFFDEGAKIENKPDIDNPYEERLARWRDEQEGRAKREETNGEPAQLPVNGHE